MTLALALALLLSADDTLTIDNTPVPVPKGCRATGNAINCSDGGFTVAPQDLSKQSPEELLTSAATMVGEVTKIDGEPEPTFLVDCTVQGKAAKCQLGSSSRLVKQRRFVLAAPISDAGKTRMAICVTPHDPRAIFPDVCRAVFSLKPGAVKR